MRAFLGNVISAGKVAERILREERILNPFEKRRLKKLVKGGKWAQEVMERYEETDRRKALEWRERNR